MSRENIFFYILDSGFSTPTKFSDYFFFLADVPKYLSLPVYLGRAPN